MKNAHTEKLKGFKKTFGILFNDEIYTGASQLSYSFIMAIIPLIMFTITIASRLTIPVQEIYSYLKFMLPQQAFKTVESILAEIINSSGFTLITILPGIYFISIGTSTFMKISNRAYHFEEKRSVIRFKGTSVVFAVLLILMIVFSLAAVVFGQVILNYIFGLLAIDYRVLYTYLRYLVSFFLLGLIISIIYAAAPNKRLRLKDVYVGGYTSAILWLLGSAAFGYYVNNFGNYGILFGSLGGIFILLSWLYWSSLILLFGIYLNAHRYKSLTQ